MRSQVQNVNAQLLDEIEKLKAENRDLRGRLVAQNAHVDTSDPIRKSLFEDYLAKTQELVVGGRNDRTISFVNQAWLDTLGYTQEEILGKPFTHFVHPDALDHCKSVFEEMMNGNAVGHVRAKFISKEGRPIEVTGDVAIECVNNETTGFHCIFLDITELEEVRRNLLRTSHVLSAMFNQAQFGMIMAELDGTILKSNEAFSRIVDVKQNDVLGRNMLSFKAPEIHEHIGSVLNQISQGIAPAKLEDYQMIRPDGSRRWVNTELLPLLNDQDSVDVIFAIIKDIDDEKQSGLELQQTTERVNRILSNSSDVFWELDRNGRFIWITHQCEEKYGFSASELLGTRGELMYSPETLEALGGLLEAIKNSQGKTIEVEKSLTHKNGEVRHFSCQVSGTFENGEFIGIAGSSHDITQRLNRKRELEASENRFKNIVESSNTFFWEVDQDGVLLYLSSNYETLSGHQISQSIRKPFTETLLMDLSNAEVFDKMLQTLEEFRDLEIPILRSNGTKMYALFSGVPLYSESGEYKGFRGSTSDITRRKIAEENLMRAMEDLKISNTELEQYAYITSHDLQEPIRHIYSYASMLTKEMGNDLSEKAALYLSFIQSSSARMREMVKQLLDFSILGNEALKIEPTDLTELIRPVLVTLCKPINESDAQIEYEGLPEVNCDRIFFSQLFQNLISNSLKFRRPNVVPQIKIKAFDMGDFHQIEFSDNGIGMRKEFLEKIFVIFQRLNSKEKFEGHGIGLSIVKKIVTKHRGNITVESELGEGTTFIMQFPK